MFGLNNLDSGKSGGFFDTVGLRDIAPHVKNGLNALPNDKLEFSNEVFEIVSQIRTNVFGRGNKIPPLGGFQTPSDAQTPLSSELMGKRLESLTKVYQQLDASEKNENKGKFGKVSVLFNLIKGMFDNFSHFGRRASNSTFSNLKM